MMQGGREGEPITYSSTGVNYDAMDPFKRRAQLHAIETSGNIERLGMKVVEQSRGESAFVWDEGDHYKAMVIEGLGTKNLVADAMRKITGKSYYDKSAQDTIAMIVNDLIVVGADPMVVSVYVASGSSEWFSDEKRAEDLTSGCKKACDMAGATWGGGESPTLRDLVVPGSAELAGAAIGIIKPKERLTLGDKLQAGDSIVLVGSSGIHANGLTLARTIADRLPEGYETRLSDGTMYGEELLRPTFIYSEYVRSLFENGLEPHYMVNITGHGWRKIMRATQEFSYIIEWIPQPQPIFYFLQEQSGNNDKEMYGNFNMGAGFAVFLPREQAERAIRIAGLCGFGATAAGRVEEGPRQVVIKPTEMPWLNIAFGGESLGVR